MTFYKQQLQKVSTLKTKEIKEWIATQETLHPKVQERLSEHPHRTVVSELAKHPSISPQMQLKLAGQLNVNVLMPLARNKSLTLEAARALISGGNREAIWELGSRGNVAEPLRSEILKGGCEPFLKAAFCSRRDLSAQEVEKLFEVGSPEELHNLFQQAPLPDRVFKEALKALGRGRDVSLAKNPSLTEAQILEVFQLGSPEANEMIAWRQGLPESVAKVMAASVSGAALRYLAGNPSVSSHLETVVQRGDGRVRRTVLQRDDCPDSIREKAFKKELGNDAFSAVLRDSYIDADRLMSVLEGATSEELHSVASNPNLPVQGQKMLAKSDDIRLLQALSLNPSLVLFDELPGQLVMNLHLWGRLNAKEIGVEEEVYSSLIRSWSGTLGELKTACEEFAKE